MDFRIEFDKILRKYGHNILLKRKKNPSVLEKHTVRHVWPSGSLAKTDAQFLEGLVYEAEMIYYFRWNVNVGEGDRIFVDPTQPDINVPFSAEVKERVQVWSASFTLPFRGRGGRVEYWAVGFDKVNDPRELK